MKLKFKILLAVLLVLVIGVGWSCDNSPATRNPDDYFSVISTIIGIEKNDNDVWRIYLDNFPKVYNVDVTNDFVRLYYPSKIPYSTNLTIGIKAIFTFYRWPHLGSYTIDNIQPYSP